MNYMPLFLVTFSTIISYTVAYGATKCYICVYSEKNGVQMPGGTEKCIDPFGEHETLDIGVDECRGMCYKSYTKRGKDVHIGRGCQINCRDDEDNGYYCCDGDFCNSSSFLTSSVAMALLSSVYLWLKSYVS